MRILPRRAARTPGALRIARYCEDLQPRMTVVVAAWIVLVVSRTWRWTFVVRGARRLDERRAFPAAVRVVMWKVCVVRSWVFNRRWRMEVQILPGGLGLILWFDVVTYRRKILLSSGDSF